jgi:DNA-binding response OmpR family regulator
MAKKILIVEDDELLAKTLYNSLKEEGYLVSVAYDGLEALALAEEKKMDLILLDLNMPKMDGLTMLVKLRETNWGKNIKVIILSNFNDEAKVLEALNNSVFCYLVKSDWDLDKIVLKIKEELK